MYFLVLLTLFYLVKKCSFFLNTFKLSLSAYTFLVHVYFCCTHILKSVPFILRYFNKKLKKVAFLYKKYKKTDICYSILCKNAF